MSRAMWDALKANPSRLADMSRDELLALCQWNDANGCWTDEQCQLEGLPPLTLSELHVIVRGWLED